MTKYVIHITLWQVKDGDFDLLEEEEVKGLEDEYESETAAREAFNTVSKYAQV
jgi:hypothetical protein